MTARFSRLAAAELQRQIDYLLERSPQAADQLAKDVKRAVADLDAGLFDGPEAELKSGQRVQTWPVPPLRIYDQRRDGTLVLVRVRHQRRRSIAK
jgi:plasmid stabilization system protein ParE